MAERGPGPDQLVIGIDVGGTKVLAAEVTPDGTVARAAVRDTPGREDVARLEDVISEALAEVAGGREVDGVGVAAAGLVSDASGGAGDAGGGGRVAFAPHLAWRDDDVRGRLAERWGTAVVLDNDATCATVAEHVHGAARGARDAVVVCVGTGIGGGLVLGGALHRGRQGMAGEFGHMQVSSAGPACPCGSRGCWEQYCSGRALLRAYIGFGGSATVSGAAITEAAADGDVAAQAAYAEVGKWLGVGVANLVAALDPELVVVGGGLSAAGDLLLDHARRVLGSSVLVGSGHRALPRMVAAELGPEAGVIGAALLVRRVLGRAGASPGTR